MQRTVEAGLPKTSNAPNLGLRARNKQRAMLQIQRVALGLFEAHGFATVTVEQVAAAADVSPSTVYRYFGTKDRLILYDEEDRIMVDMFLAAVTSGLSLIGSARHVVESMRVHFELDDTSLRQRFCYMVDEPVVRTAMMKDLQATTEYLVEHVCVATSRERGDTSVLLAISTLLNTVLICAEVWRKSDFSGDYFALLTQCLDQLESGLAL